MDLSLPHNDASSDRVAVHISRSHKLDGEVNGLLFSEIGGGSKLEFSEQAPDLLRREHVFSCVEDFCFNERYKLSFVHSFIHSFIRLFIHSFICSFIHSFIHSITNHSFIRLFIHSFIRLFIHSFTRLFVHSFVCSVIHSFIHSFILPKHRKK